MPGEESAVAGRKHYGTNINMNSVASEPIPHGARGGHSTLSTQATFQFAPGADDSASHWKSSNAAMMEAAETVPKPGADATAARSARRAVKPGIDPSAGSLPGAAGAPFATSARAGAGVAESSYTSGTRSSVKRADNLLESVAAAVAAKISAPEAASAYSSAATGRLAALETSAKAGRATGAAESGFMSGYTGRMRPGADTAKRDMLKKLPIV